MTSPPHTSFFPCACLCVPYVHSFTVKNNQLWENDTWSIRILFILPGVSFFWEWWEQSLSDIYHPISFPTAIFSHYTLFARLYNHLNMFSLNSSLIPLANYANDWWMIDEVQLFCFVRKRKADMAYCIRYMEILLKHTEKSCLLHDHHCCRWLELMLFLCQYLSCLPYVSNIYQPLMLDICSFLLPSNSFITASEENISHCLWLN